MRDKAPGIDVRRDQPFPRRIPLMNHQDLDIVQFLRSEAAEGRELLGRDGESMLLARFRVRTRCLRYPPR